MHVNLIVNTRAIPSFFTSSVLVKDVTKPEELLSIGLDDSCCGVSEGGGGAC